MVEDNDNFAFMRIVWRLMEENPGKSPDELFPLFEAEVTADEKVKKSVVAYGVKAVLREEGGD